MNKFDDRKTESKLVKEINTECFTNLHYKMNNNSVNIYQRLIQ